MSSSPVYRHKQPIAYAPWTFVVALVAFGVFIGIWTGYAASAANDAKNALEVAGWAIRWQSWATPVIAATISASAAVACFLVGLAARRAWIEKRHDTAGDCGRSTDVFLTLHALTSALGYTLLTWLVLAFGAAAVYAFLISNSHNVINDHVLKLTAWEGSVAKVSNPNVAPTGTVEAVYQAIYHHGIDGLQLLEAVASDMGMCGLDCLSVFTMPYLEPTRPGATCQCDLALLRITSNRLHDAEKACNVEVACLACAFVALLTMLTSSTSMAARTDAECDYLRRLSAAPAKPGGRGWAVAEAWTASSSAQPPAGGQQQGSPSHWVCRVGTPAVGGGARSNRVLPAVAGAV